ncbi:putative UDP-glucose 4-epimerase [Helianthus annuus]|uniref:UDP-glucose 4-epimerase n=1 Tax=Helianthus annuus TaxID=4232 RepID=A0A9K3E2U2_HELAN|nr:putative UDP-glucose 4-epimerase [Helianthus annuus]KAJ0832563.1 putative UDP-glucose 4-epimerase [Helianthus annuus]
MREAFYLHKIVFLSSAIVYGWPNEVMCIEDFPKSAGCSQPIWAN